MKFLVLALCVCAASAASFTPFGKPYQPVGQTFAQAVSSSGPSAYNAAKAVVTAPVVAAKTAYSATKDAVAEIVRSDSDVKPDGFNYYYETNNGIAAQASGITKRIGNEDVIVYQGSYKYYDPEGKEVVVTYVADENGYQPQGNVLPVGPEIPEAILKSLDYIRANYKPENFERKNY